MSKQITDNRLQRDFDPDCEEPRAFSRRLVELQEAERRALSRDLHDTAGQAMTVLSLGLAMLRREEGCSERMLIRIDELRHVVETAGEDLRRLSVNLRPSSLDRYGLAAALEQLVASVRRQTAISFDLQVNLGEERLPGEVETALYRIVQEACTNITRYASASFASVVVQFQGEAVEVTVEDNGRGFDVAEALQRGRLGLVGMAERAEVLGGSLVVESKPGQGTRLVAHVPLFVPGLSEVGSPRTTALVRSPTQAGPTIRTTSNTPVRATNAAEAAELARAKALSDVLVEIMAAAASSATADDILALVLARTAAAIACDTVHIDVREGASWVTRFDDRGVEVGHRFVDEQVPALLEVERTRSVLVINDTNGDVPDERLRLSEYGVRSYACIPLLAHGTLQGVLTFINFSAPEPFSSSEIGFFNRLAGLLSLALENGHLREIEAQQRTDLSERVEELEALLDVLPVGIGIAYDRECRKIKVNPAFAKMLGIPPEANASLTADEAERPRNFKVLQDGRELAPEELPMQRSAAQGEEVRDLVVEVVRDDGDTLTLLEYSVPLYDAHNQPRGSVGAFIDVTQQAAAAQKYANQRLTRLAKELQQTNAEDELREAAQRLDQRVQERTAELAEREAWLREAIAQKERALRDLEATMQELQASRKQLHHLAHRIVEIQEQERSYVADHLYNQAGQMLAALKMQLKLLEKQRDGSPSLASVTEMQSVLDQTLRDLHELAARLHPVGLDHSVGVGLLCDYVTRFSRAHGLSARVCGEEVDKLELAPQTMTAVYRSLEEALSNVVRHARATEFLLNIACQGDIVRISLWDNGIGFDPATTHRKCGVGLISIRERMQSVGGQVAVESGPGGTALVLSAPLKGCNDHPEDPN